MGPGKWFLIENKEVSSFDQKIRRTKEVVYDVIGLRAGTEFDKKYLLRKNTGYQNEKYPIDISKIEGKYTEI